MKIPAICIASALTLIGLHGEVSAQSSSSKNTTTETAGPRRFWQASLPGGDYVVALSQITSVSKHTYILDGGLKVTEVVIDTSGNSLVRFYSIIPITEAGGSAVGAGITERGKEILDRLGDRTGANANTMVSKQYPTTTHAKTVEYRLANEANLDRLFNSIRRAWINGAGKKFTIKNQ